MNLRGELEIDFAVGVSVGDQPDRPALGVTGLHDAREELSEELFAPQLLFAQVHHLGNELLNSKLGRFNTLILSHR
jgi:hypothetical protein